MAGSCFVCKWKQDGTPPFFSAYESPVSPANCSPVGWSPSISVCTTDEDAYENCSTPHTMGFTWFHHPCLNCVLFIKRPPTTPPSSRPADLGPSSDLAVLSARRNRNRAPAGEAFPDTRRWTHWGGMVYQDTPWVHLDPRGTVMSFGLKALRANALFAMQLQRICHLLGFKGSTWV